jgi:hypothetical protein
MAHTIGKLVVPIRTGKSSGKPSARAIQSPTTAPTKPSAIDTRQPPREKPVIACPKAPQIPATISKMSKSNNVILAVIIPEITRFSLSPGHLSDISLTLSPVGQSSRFLAFDFTLLNLRLIQKSIAIENLA